MVYDPRLPIDMTPDGRFRAPPRMPVSTRIIVGAVLVAAVAAGLAFAAFALWIALMLIPVVIAAGLVAFVALKFKLWQGRRRAAASRSPGPVAPWR